MNVYCEMYSANVVKIDYNYDLKLTKNLEKIVKKLDHLVIANPNQPTEPILNQKDLIKIIANAKKNVSVFIDEAYIEFVKVPIVKWDKYINKYNNIFVQKLFLNFLE